MDAAHGQGRDGFGGHPWGGQSGLSGNGHVQRRVDAPFQRAGRRKGRLPPNIKEARKNSGHWQVSRELAANVVRFLLRMGRRACTSERRRWIVEPWRAGAWCLRSAARVATPVSFQSAGGCRPRNCTGNYRSAGINTGRGRSPTRICRGCASWRLGKTSRGHSFSTDLRVPLPLVGTNACIAPNSNGAAGNVWSAFTSETSQGLPSAGTMTFIIQLPGEARTALPAGGPGYLRPPSLADCG